MSTVATDEMVWLAREWEDLYGSAVLSGIVGDLAHRRQGGYHISRQDQPAGNYSVVRSDDRAGPGNAAAAIDMSMNAADMKLCTSRLRAVYARADDPRRVFINAFNGWLGSPHDASRWDVAAGAVSWATPDHKWHVHLEVRRRYVESMAAMQAIRSALAGEPVSLYAGGGAVSKDDVLDALNDSVPWSSAGIGAQATRAGWSNKSTRALLEYVWAALALNKEAEAKRIAREEAILQAVTGGTITTETIREEFARFRGELVQEIAPLLAAAVREELGEAESAQVEEAMARAIRTVLGSLDQDEVT